MIIDTHAHLTWESFKSDFKDVLKRAKDAGVEKVINIGADLEGSKESANLCNIIESYCEATSFAYSTIGLHPHEALNLSTDESLHQHIDRLEEIYNKYPNKVVAVGECGLDYYFAGVDYSPSQKKLFIAKQQALLIAQIELAKKLDLPLVIHNRDRASTSSAPSAWDDIFVPELKGTKGVFHSFTGNLEQAQKVLDLGYYLGFTCVVTYPKNNLLGEVISKVPIERILVETDCPFLPPQTMRGQRNEPANVCEVIKVISEVKNIPFEEAVQTTTQNAIKLFTL